jgi:hypothetical protein
MEGGAVGHNFERDTPRDHLCHENQTECATNPTPQNSNYMKVSYFYCEFESRSGRGIQHYVIRLFSGFLAIILATKGQYLESAIAIFVAMLWDALDGRVANFVLSNPWHH